MTHPSAAPPPEEPDPLPKEGDILAGKYRIEKVLGQGGMGVVVAAQHTTLRQRVAVKFLLPEAAKREDATERFLREARAAVSIQSEHVARVMDVGTLETGSPYMVMEFLTGNDLGVLLADRGPFAIAEAVDYILQACEAIAEAHAIGIIHRDLKPANLFLSQRADGSPLIKVLDFGLSKVTKPDALDASLTAHNVVMGSPCYMSPEQIRSLKGLDARTDIWALGVILYQLLTGVRPFEAPSLGALFFTIGADPPKPPHEHRAEIPPGLEAAILNCLNKDSTRRTQSIAELARALAPFGGDDSRISVERIHRVLSDSTPLPIRRSVGDGTDDAIELRTASLLVVGDNDPTLAHPGAGSGPQPNLPAAFPSRPPPAAPSSPPAAPMTAQALSTPAHDQVKSGSMAAIAKDGAFPSSPPTRAVPNSNRNGIVAATISVSMAVVAVVAFLGMRNTGPAPTPMATPMGAAPTAETATPAPTVVPSETATAEAAPPASASATAEASTAKPAAEPSVTTGSPVGAPKPPVPKGTKPSPPTTKKSKDVYDKWK